MTTITMPAEVPGLRSGFIASLQDVEWRQAGNAHDYTFTGRAIVYDSWSEEMWTPLGTFRERIRPGALTDVLATSPDVRLLYNHDERYVLGRTKSGTLELTEEENGLHVWARVAPTSYAKDLRMVMARGDVDQMSFAFMMDEERGAEDRWYEEDDGIRRDILKISDLIDVSPVTYPAYFDTTAAMREIRTAVEAGKIDSRVTPNEMRELLGYPNTNDSTFTLGTVAQDDPADEQSAPVSAEAETDPPVDEERDVSAPAETDPVVGGSAVLRAESREALRKAKEDYLRVL